MTSQKPIHFWKMHGLGNDFMLIDGRQQTVDAGLIPVSEWADRHTGVGFDQLLWLSSSEKADVFCRIYNSDGKQAEQCGNGMRCVAAYLSASEPASTSILTIETVSGIVTAVIQNDSQIEITMGIPHCQPGWLTFNMAAAAKPVDVFALSLGNPHVILKVDQLDTFPVKTVADEIAAQKVFAEGVNVGVMQIMDPHTLRLRTVERGAGETLACGSNACAAAVTGILHHQMKSPIKVLLPRGDLRISWNDPASPLQMTGPAHRIYEGFITSEP